VETECFFKCRITEHDFENCRSQRLCATHTLDFGETLRRNNVDGDGTPNSTQRFTFRAPVRVRYPF
jgi:hypothetical protein